MDTVKYCQLDFNCDSCGRQVKRELQFVEGQPSVKLTNKWWCPNGLCNASYSIEYRASETVRGNACLTIDKFYSSEKKRKVKKMTLPVI